MHEWVSTPLLAALGFFLGFFYTRTMKLAERLPEDYATKEDCRSFRQECRRGIELGRGEVLERVERIESKLDRLMECVVQAGTARLGQHGQ